MFKIDTSLPTFQPYQSDNKMKYIVNYINMIDINIIKTLRNNPNFNEKMSKMLDIFVKISELFDKYQMDMVKYTLAIKILYIINGIIDDFLNYPDLFHKMMKIRIVLEQIINDAYVYIEYEDDIIKEDFNWLLFVIKMIDKTSINDIYKLHPFILLNIYKYINYLNGKKYHVVMINKTLVSKVQELLIKNQNKIFTNFIKFVK